MTLPVLVSILTPSLTKEIWADSVTASSFTCGGFISGWVMKELKSCPFMAIMASPLAGVVRISFWRVMTADMSKSHCCTVASIARHVNPRGLRQPLPLTVTGPTCCFRSRSDEDAVTSHFTPLFSANRNLRATTASLEIKVEVTPFPDIDFFEFSDASEVEEGAALRCLATDGGDDDDCIRCCDGFLPPSPPLLLLIPRALRDLGRVLIICMSNAHTLLVAVEASRDINTARDGVMFLLRLLCSSRILNQNTGSIYSWLRLAQKNCVIVV